MFDNSKVQVSRKDAKKIALLCAFAPLRALRETSFPSGRPTAIKLSRHFGRDAENQAMDGNQMVVQVLDSGYLPALR